MSSRCPAPQPCPALDASRPRLHRGLVSTCAITPASSMARCALSTQPAPRPGFSRFDAGEPAALTSGVVPRDLRSHGRARAARSVAPPVNTAKMLINPSRRGVRCGERWSPAAARRRGQPGGGAAQGMRACGDDGVARVSVYERARADSCTLSHTHTHVLRRVGARCARRPHLAPIRIVRALGDRPV